VIEAIANAESGASVRAKLNAAIGRCQALEEHSTFYVDPAGDDGGDGSEGDPWATLQRASNVLCATDFNGYDATIQLPEASIVGACFNGLHSSRASIDGYAPTITNCTSTLFIQGDEADAGTSALTAISAQNPAILSINGSPSVNVAIKNFTLDYSDPPANGAVVYCYNTTLFIGDGNGGEMRGIGISTPGATQGDLIDLCSASSAWHLDKLTMEGGFDYAFVLGGGGTGCTLYSFAEFNLGADARFGGAFVYCRDNSLAEFGDSVTFTGTATGKRFVVEAGSTIDITRLSGSSKTTLPGDTAGLVINGGAYLSATEALRDFSHLPTSDPHVAGLLWKNAGALAISAG
jgi:hypothetical protein